MPAIPFFVDGVTPDSDDLYFLDFTTDEMWIWSDTCTHPAIGVYPEGNCNTSPMLLDNDFNPLASGVSVIGQTFTDRFVSGYTVSGKVVYTTCCDGDSCFKININNVDQAT